MFSRSMQLALYGAALSLMVLSVFHAVSLFQSIAMPVLKPVAEQRITRGPQDASEQQYQEWIKHVEQMPPELSTAAWLQQQATGAISVNAEIPVWGVFLAILTGVGAFFSLREQMKGHIKNDDTNFAELKSSVKDLGNKIEHLQNLIRNEPND